MNGLAAHISCAVMMAACGGGSDAPPAPSPPTPGSAKPAPVDAAAVPIDAEEPVPAIPAAPPVPIAPAGMPGLPSTFDAARITKEAVALGETLFYDPRLAINKRTSCASCHDPAHDYAGGMDRTATGQPNLRRTPSLANLAWKTEYGWDGRYPTIDDLLVAHVKGQLGEPLETSVWRVARLPVYRAMFARVDGEAPAAAQRALAAFVLTRYQGGTETPDDAKAGHKLFTGKAQCAVCHTPPLYTEGGYHKVVRGVYDDPGRGAVEPAKQGMFVTPTLRGAALRTAFFHDGSVTSLTDAFDHPLDPALATPKLTPEEREQLRAFIATLDTDAPPVEPKLP